MSSVSTTNISGTDPGTDHDFGRPSGTGVFLYRYPGTSYLATITLSLRDKIHSSAEALLKFNAYGIRSRASGAARPWNNAQKGATRGKRGLPRLPDTQRRTRGSASRATRADHRRIGREPPATSHSPKGSTD